MSVLSYIRFKVLHIQNLTSYKLHATDPSGIHPNSRTPQSAPVLNVDSQRRAPELVKLGEDDFRFFKIISNVLGWERVCNRAWARV